MPTTFETKAYAMKDATISNTALTMTGIGFTAAQLARARRALITVDVNNVRITYDGTTPTASLGHAVSNNLASFYLEGNANIQNLQLIRGSGTDGEVTITLETDLG